MTSTLIWDAQRDGPNFPNIGRDFPVRTAGEHLIFVSGSAFNTAVDVLISVRVIINTNHVGTMAVFVNGGGRHQCLVPCYIKIRLPATTPGNLHNINLVRGASTDFNNDDWFNITIIENI
jgi:hypothetical protein